MSSPPVIFLPYEEPYGKYYRDNFLDMFQYLCVEIRFKTGDKYYNNLSRSRKVPESFKNYPFGILIPGPVWNSYKCGYGPIDGIQIYEGNLELGLKSKLYSWLQQALQKDDFIKVQFEMNVAP